MLDWFKGYKEFWKERVRCDCEGRRKSRRKRKGLKEDTSNAKKVDWKRRKGEKDLTSGIQSMSLIMKWKLRRRRLGIRRSVRFVVPCVAVVALRAKHLGVLQSTVLGVVLITWWKESWTNFRFGTLHELRASSFASAIRLLCSTKRLYAKGASAHHVLLTYNLSVSTNRHISAPLNSIASFVCDTSHWCLNLKRNELKMFDVSYQLESSRSLFFRISWRVSKSYHHDHLTRKREGWQFI